MATRLTSAGPGDERLLPGRLQALKAELDRQYAAYDRSGRLPDPIELVRPYRDPADREVAGFLTAGLAFGRVAGIMKSVGAVLAAMGPTPSRFVLDFSPSRDAIRLADCGHRWTRGIDLAGVIWVLRHMLRTAGSIEQYFLAGDEPGSDDVMPGLESLCRRARALDLSPVYGTQPGVPGAHRFFSLPSAGSACKRLNLFLRWMVRDDGIDLGVWRRVPASRLIVPLDVHVIRVSACLGLTRYASEGWRMAADITRTLRLLDPGDPVRYDFALCHIGMSGLCGFRQKAGDSQCPLRGVCQPHPRTPRSSRRPSDRR
jgi:uncharacterized protein (TIGR02757 family)